MGFDIVATGNCVPKTAVSNFDLEKIVDTSDEWIFTRTGIRQRFFAGEETTEDLGFGAAKKVLENAGIEKNKIKAIIVPTFTADYMTPSVACLLQTRLHLSENILALDINAACSGFIYALKIADGLFTGMEEESYILIVGTEVISKLLNFEDRGTCILFGDGAGAVLLKKNSKKQSIFSVGSKGTKTELGCPGIHKDGLKPQVYMDGKAVFRFATTTIVRCIEEILKNSGTKKEEIDCIVCHQANSRIIDYAQKKLDIPKEKFYMNIHSYGNTSSASIPIALAEMNEQGMLKKGMKVLMVGFGGGFTWGGTLIEW